MRKNKKTRAKRTKTKTAKVQKPKDEPFYSDQTTFYDSDEEYQTCITNQISYQPEQKLQNSKDFDGSLNKLQDSVNFQSDQPKRSQKFPFKFISVSKQYEQVIYQKYNLQNQTTSYQNSCIKILEANLKKENQKLQLLQKLTKKSIKNQKILYKKSNENSIQPVSYNKLSTSDIEIYICSCNRYIADYRNFTRHLKNSSHSKKLEINTKKQRKNQQKYYDIKIQIGKNIPVNQFNPQWLYKSFQPIFLQGNLHYELLHMIDLTSIYSHMPSNKDQDNRQQAPKISSYFHKLLIEIYNKLHQFHKGYAILSHKCMTKDQHIALFLLGFKFLFKKIESSQNSQIPQTRNHKLVLNTVTEVLFQLIQLSQNNTKITQKKESQKDDIIFKKNILRQMLDFFKCFDYIDIQDLLQIEGNSILIQ